MFPCQRYHGQPLTRRDLLTQAANGFGAVALSSMLARNNTLAATESARNSLATKAGQFPGKAKNIIFLYMDGGPSQVDSFDPKPVLDRYDGRTRMKSLARLNRLSLPTSVKF